MRGQLELGGGRTNVYEYDSAVDAIDLVGSDGASFGFEDEWRAWKRGERT